ncbi:MAG: SH3 domain-containing protein [Chloroflexota bacterium]
MAIGLLLLGLAWPAPIRAQQAPAGIPGDASRIPNNIVGLNLARLHQGQWIWAASDLVNANGGDWGYITVTWTRDDRDRYLADYELQQFLDRCLDHHVQPIIRVATRFDTKRQVWAGPEWDEPRKWREFLENANWPVERVWIIAGNEPNLGREWSGEVDAAGYARYLAHFMDEFAGSPRFKVVNAPLDISNGTDLPRMQDALEFIAEMRAAVPNIFERLPAWASNPYRVPSGGSAVRYTHRAYEAELDAAGRDMPVLITEAHAMETTDEQEIARFFEDAYRDWAADPRVITATPLFWHPDTGVFWMFSMTSNGAIKSRSPTYFAMKSLPRVAGRPGYVPAFENVARAPREPELTLDLLGVVPPFAVSSPPLAMTVLSTAEGSPGDDQYSAAAFAQPSGASVAASAWVQGTLGRGVNVRERPDLAAIAVSVLPEGARVGVLGDRLELNGESWYPVRVADGTEGWMLADFLVMDQEGRPGASGGASGLHQGATLRQ